jgi:GNAT superfamily N-acetyltransferase
MEDDTSKVLELIKKLARYEKMEDQVKNTKEALFDHLFIKKSIHALVAVENDQIVGFALYFYTYSTFVGKQGIYLEDVYVEESFRHLGIGTQFFKTLAQRAIDLDLERFEWTCLDWNTPALDFYAKIGAKQMNRWITHRLDRAHMEAFIKHS